MPPKKFSALSEDQLHFIDAIINENYPNAAESTKKIHANCVKKVFEILKIDPVAPITMTYDEMTEKFTEALHQVHQPKPEFIQQNAKRIMDFCSIVKKRAEDASKPPERLEFEQWIQTPEGYQWFLENRNTLKRKAESAPVAHEDLDSEDDADTVDNETDEEETKKIEAAELHKIKKRK